MMGTPVKGWIEENLGNLCDIYQPKTISTRDLIESGQYPVYGANGIIGKYDKYNHENSELLITCRGATCGAVNISSPKSWINGNAMVVRPKHDFLERKFLEYFFRGVVDLGRVITGSAQPQITRQSLSPVLLRFPSNNEQKRIAKKLDNIFTRSRETREELAAVPRLIERYKQAILSAAFSGELTRDWRNVEDASSEWEHTDIQSVATVGTGSTPLKSNKSFYSSSGTPWVTSSATGKPYIDMAEEFVTKEAISASRLKVFPIGTLLVAMYGEGKTRGQVSELRIDATINQACAAIVVNQKRILKSFLKYILVAGYLDMRELATGGNQPNLNLTKIKEYPLPLPPLKEQNEIALRIEKAFSAIDTIADQTAAGLRQISHLETQCLNKAFRGELVPQDPNDEPASVLLERLHAETASAVLVKKTQKKAAKKKA